MEQALRSDPTRVSASCSSQNYSSHQSKAEPGTRTPDSRWQRLVVYTADAPFWDLAVPLSLV